MAVCFKCKRCGAEHEVPWDLADRFKHNKNRDTNSKGGVSIYCDIEWRMADYDLSEFYMKDTN